MPTREFRLAELTREKESLVYPLMERVLFFKGVEIFKNCESEKLLAVAEITEEEKYLKGERVARENEIGESLFIVKKGSLKAIKNSLGKDFVLHIIKAGEVFGEMSLFGEHEREAGALANEDCEIYRIKKSEFKRILLDNPGITYNILEIFAERVRESNKTILLLNSRLNQELLADIKKANN